MRTEDISCLVGDLIVKYDNYFRYTNSGFEKMFINTLINDLKVLEFKLKEKNEANND